MNKPIALGVALSLGGCHLEPPAVPAREADRRIAAVADARTADESRKHAEAEVEAARALKQRSASRLAELESREQSFQTDQQRYPQAIAEAQAVARHCSIAFARLVELHAYLTRFAAEPQRDAAILGLERCRKRAAAARKKEHIDAQVGLRQLFADVVVEQFLAKNPDAPKDLLTAEVKGTVLRLSLRDAPDWDQAAMQRAVDALCLQSEHFTEIVWSARGRSVRCRPAIKPADYPAHMVRADGLAESWVPVLAGPTNTPVVGASSPVDQAELARLRRELAGSTHGLEAATAALAHAELALGDAKLRQADLDRMQEGREAEWRDRMKRRARNRVYNSIPANLIGAAFGISGLYFLAVRSAIISGKREFSSEPERAGALRTSTTLAIVGSAVGLSLIATGLALYFTGKRRMQRFSTSAGGLTISF